ncbi:HAD-IA family hydrolase [Streptomyces sp. NBC_01221]|uniref:HAD family hydrolase n=1 Tax=Streptomyces sp. NBC_01221 TaxID=2903782 RepID=UPI00224D29FA|nr:HAD-IA family hydrolase [Streptomyces sp. NBC_01221]MCX4785426.1 HAD-IA family hydrolase [Streptomyces sp. NBC_01221]
MHPPSARSTPTKRRPSGTPSHALLLDLDGVLLDTRPVMESAWLEVQKTHGLDMPFASYERHLGREFSDIMHRLGVGDAELVHETYEAASRAASHLAQQFAGIAEVLHAFVAAEWRLGVVTSKPLDRAAPLLAQLGCPFATVRTPSSLGRAKPAPDPILLALIDLGVDPSGATYVGDMAVDQEAAARAGVAYVHAGWGYGQPNSPVPGIVESPQELLQLLHPADSSEPFVEGSLV